MRFAHECQCNRRGNAALESKKHLRGIFDVRPEVWIRGRSSDRFYLIAREPAQPVNQVNPRRQGCASPGEAALQIPRREIQKSEMLEGGVRAGDNFSDCAIVDQILRFLQLRVKAVRHTDV